MKLLLSRYLFKREKRNVSLFSLLFIDGNAPEVGSKEQHSSWDYENQNLQDIILSKQESLYLSIYLSPKKEQPKNHIYWSY